MSGPRCYAPYYRAPDEWCRRGSVWGYVYTNEEGELTTLYTCAAHMNVSVKEVFRTKHPDSHVEVIGLGSRPRL